MLYLGTKLDTFFNMKIIEFLLTCLKMILGTLLLFLLVIMWALLLWFTTAISVVEYIESKISILINKCYGEL
jgi:hypothetical protein